MRLPALEAPRLLRGPGCESRIQGLSSRGGPVSRRRPPPPSAAMAKKSTYARRVGAGWSKFQVMRAAPLRRGQKFDLCAKGGRVSGPCAAFRPLFSGLRGTIGARRLAKLEILANANRGSSHKSIFWPTRIVGACISRKNGQTGLDHGRKLDSCSHLAFRFARLGLGKVCVPAKFTNMKLNVTIP